MVGTNPTRMPDGMTALVERALDRSGGRSASRATNVLFHEITGVDPYQLPNILLRDASIPQSTSARATRDCLAGLLRVRKADASELLGSSDSRFSRNDTVDRDILDRTFAILDIFVPVAAALGAANAADWLNSPHAALDGQVPIRLLGTNYGRKLVNDLVDALLAGAYV